MKLCVTDKRDKLSRKQKILYVYNILFTPKWWQMALKSLSIPPQVYLAAHRVFYFLLTQIK